MKDCLNVCLIGTGRAGMIHARSYMGNVVGARLLAICDPCEENLKKSPRRTSCCLYVCGLSSGTTE